MSEPGQIRAGDGKRPALGRCCYEPPTAVCSGCGQEAPCRYAQTDWPLCSRCLPKSTSACVDCGRERRVQRRLADGPVCDGCYHRRLTAKLRCAGCGQTRRPAVRTAGARTLCADCAGIHELPVCSRCGAEDQIRRGLCPACLLADRLTSCAHPPHFRAQRSWRPTSTRWRAPPIRRRRCAGCRRRRSRTSARSSRATSSSPTPGSTPCRARSATAARSPSCAPRWSSTASLEPRDEPAAAFARWLAGALDELAEGPDRGHVRAFATWQVAHRLTQASRTGRTSASTEKYARAQVREAIKLVRWLHGQGLTLAELHQHHLDAWLAAGASTRRLVRLFLAWLARTQTIAPLAAPWNAQTGSRRRSMTTGVSPSCGGCCTASLDPRERLAGALVVLLGQPLTRIAQLRRADLLETDGTVALRLGRRPVELPGPLARVALELRDQPAGRAASPPPTATGCYPAANTAAT